MVELELALCTPVENVVLLVVSTQEALSFEVDPARGETLLLEAILVRPARWTS